MAGDERVRLFCAFELPLHTTERIVEWQARELRGRLVEPANLHVTLAFLGSRPRNVVEDVAAALESSVRAFQPPVLSARRYRETRSVGMLELCDERGRARLIAEQLHEMLAILGVYEPEKRRWLPHVTALRFREPPRLRPRVPDLGRFSPSEAAVYHSVLRPSGAQYEVLESVALGG